MPPPHHDARGGFRIPWPMAERPRGGVLRWQIERLLASLPPNPPPEALPRAEPAIARPAGAPGELRATWVGHAAFLLQVGGLNVLTDPVWSERASPFSWAGPRRFTPPGVAFADLPAIDAVLLSHDHYDHLDAPTVRALVRRFGDDLHWITPLGYRGWLGRHGAHRVTELDWWEPLALPLPGGGEASLAALPIQHWTSRRPWERNRRLWASYALRTRAGAVYFAGDSGYWPGFAEIGERAGPFDLLLLPIGAYAPRWFMRAAHMNPEEAVRAYQELGGVGTFGAMHWGTFRLTDEDPLEPPGRTRAAWRAAGLPPDALWIPAHGETWRGDGV